MDGIYDDQSTNGQNSNQTQGQSFGDQGQSNDDSQVAQTQSVPSDVTPQVPQTHTAGQTQTAQGQSGQMQDDKKPKIDLPEISEEEVKSFDMRNFDKELKPDLNSLSNDSLGKALGTTGSSAGVTMTAAQQYDDILNTQIPAHNLNFDEAVFKSLLAGSISLLYDEKKAIIGQIPKLSQFQIDELTKILTEEKKKFAQLNKKHVTELKKLEEKHENKEEKEQLHQEEQALKQNDQAQAEELLRKLQGN